MVRIRPSLSMGRIPALDGLRAVAIAMVVGYHIDKTVVPAGHWGVTLFFVLSGFVITGSLCAEVERTGSVARWSGTIGPVASISARSTASACFASSRPFWPSVW